MTDSAHLNTVELDASDHEETVVGVVFSGLLVIILISVISATVTVLIKRWSRGNFGFIKLSAVNESDGQFYLASIMQSSMA